MNLYFGNKTTTITTLMLVVLVGVIIYIVLHKESIHHWGWCMLALAVYGLVLCSYAAARDGLDKTIQCAIDGSVAPGLFQLISIPTVAGCIGAAMIIISGIICIFAKSQHVKQTLFFIMSAGVMLKVITVEISRIVLYIKG